MSSISSHRIKNLEYDYNSIRTSYMKLKDIKKGIRLKIQRKTYKVGTDCTPIMYPYPYLYPLLTSSLNKKLGYKELITGLWSHNLKVDPSDLFPPYFHEVTVWYHLKAVSEEVDILSRSVSPQVLSKKLIQKLSPLEQKMDLFLKFTD